MVRGWNRGSKPSGAAVLAKAVAVLASVAASFTGARAVVHTFVGQNLLLMPGARRGMHAAETHQRLAGLARRAGGAAEGEQEGAESQAEGRPPARSTGPKLSPEEFWREAFEERSWLNPARGFSRRNVLESSAEIAQQSAAALAVISVLEKAGMISRVASGLSPIDDNLVIEQSGRLVSVVSGVLLPAAQGGAVPGRDRR